jgi:spore photoproduct lyase
VSFSLNPPAVVATEEGVAASLDERLAAAERAISRGYRVAFHFDPMIHVPDWEQAYIAVVDRLAAYRRAAPEWISLGTLRYPPSLKPTIEERTYALDEFVRSGDGKMRYLQPIRARMYRTVKKRLRSVLPETPVYLCMESPVVWRDMQRAAPGDETPLRAIMQPVVIGEERAGGMR